MLSCPECRLAKYAGVAMKTSTRDISVFCEPAVSAVVHMWCTVVFTTTICSVYIAALSNVKNKCSLPLKYPADTLGLKSRACQRSACHRSGIHSTKAPQCPLKFALNIQRADHSSTGRIYVEVIVERIQWRFLCVFIAQSRKRALVTTNTPPNLQRQKTCTDRVCLWRRPAWWFSLPFFK